MIFRATTILLLAASLVACGKPPPPIGSASDVTVLDTNTLPQPTRADITAGVRPYLIGPFDKLTINVFGIDELSRQNIQTDASGRISFPLLGVVEAAGKTPGELANDIEARLQGRYVRNPQVTVNLDETVSQVITVDGQVARSGLYPVLGRMTLLRAVATAGGTTEFAQLEDVVIFREVGGQQYAGLYNLEAIRRGNYKDPEVFANDIVVVGDSKARRRFRDLIQVAPLLASPLVILAQNL